MAVNFLEKKFIGSVLSIHSDKPRGFDFSTDRCHWEGYSEDCANECKKK